jgi:hypothetical protein
MAIILGPWFCYPSEGSGDSHLNVTFFPEAMLPFFVGVADLKDLVSL